MLFMTWYAMGSNNVIIRMYLPATQMTLSSIPIHYVGKTTPSLSMLAKAEPAMVRGKNISYYIDNTELSYL